MQKVHFPITQKLYVHFKANIISLFKRLSRLSWSFFNPNLKKKKDFYVEDY